MVVISAQFKIKPDCVEKWRELIGPHSARCVEREPGCLYFDVSEDPADPARWLLYEVYRDSAALAEHRQAPHFPPFFKAAQELFETRTVAEFRRFASNSK